MPDYPEEGALRGGHIPTREVDPVGQGRRGQRTFRSRAELDELYGLPQPDDKTVVYCRIGERSSHTWFVLTHLLGQPGVRNYDGSWTEWGNAVRVPVAVGDEPGEAPGQHDRHAGRAGRGGVGLRRMQGQDKLQLLLEFANELPPIPADLEESAMEPVPECQSPLFLHVDATDRDTRPVVLQRAARGADDARLRAILSAGLDELRPTRSSPCRTTSTPTSGWRR